MFSSSPKRSIRELGHTGTIFNEIVAGSFLALDINPQIQETQ